MKIRVLFIALVFAASSSAFGSGGPGMTVVPLKGSETFKVIYKGTTHGNVRLNVLDEAGRTLHSTTFSSVEGFIVPVTFRGLESGKYTIQVVDHEGSYEEDVNYSPFTSLKSIHVSKLSNEDGKFLLAIRNAQNELIQVRIFDQFHRVLYDESKTLSGDFATVFRMDNASHAYTFEISDASGDRRFFDF